MSNHFESGSTSGAGGGHLNAWLEHCPRRGPLPTSHGQSCRDAGAAGSRADFYSHTLLLRPQRQFHVTSFRKVTEGSLMHSTLLRVPSLGDHDLRQWATDDKNHEPNLWGAGRGAGEDDEEEAGRQHLAAR